jgi:hypothetical protein
MFSAGQSHARQRSVMAGTCSARLYSTPAQTAATAAAPPPHAASLPGHDSFQG